MTRQERQKAFNKAIKLALEVINDLTNSSWDKYHQIYDICYENDLDYVEDIKDEDGNRGFMIEDYCFYFKNQEI